MKAKEGGGNRSKYEGTAPSEGGALGNQCCVDAGPIEKLVLHVKYTGF